MNGDSMSIQYNNIEILKHQLAICKEQLDIAYQNQNFINITEAAEKIAKLSYTITYLKINYHIEGDEKIGDN